MKSDPSIFMDTSNTSTEAWAGLEERTLSCELVNVCKGVVRRAGLR